MRAKFAQRPWWPKFIARNSELIMSDPRKDALQTPQDQLTGVQARLTALESKPIDPAAAPALDERELYAIRAVLEKWAGTELSGFRAEYDAQQAKPAVT
jgi:hypothetical protein